jgi:exodeoxyribonuclease V gamma subunit
MLLGYAMESRQGEWQSILPYDESSGLIAELVGHLASLLMQLNTWRQGLAQARPLEEWLPVCREMLNDFFLPDQDTEAALALIEQQWQAIIAQGLMRRMAKIFRFPSCAMNWRSVSIRSVSASASWPGR